MTHARLAAAAWAAAAKDNLQLAHNPQQIASNLQLAA